MFHGLGLSRFVPLFNYASLRLLQRALATLVPPLVENGWRTASDVGSVVRTAEVEAQNAYCAR
jgi:hypothetical protein